MSQHSSLKSNNRKLMFPEIIPTTVTTKIILLNTYITFTEDVYELWILFYQFKEKQAIGLVENQNNKYFDRFDFEIPIVGRFNYDVMLINTKILHTEAWEPTDQNIIDAMAVENLKVVNWNTYINVFSRIKKNDYFGSLNSKILKFNGTNARKQPRGCVNFTGNNQSNITDKLPASSNCTDFDAAYLHRWRTLLYFREFQYNPSKDDVTLVSHFTYDGLLLLEKLAKRWEGPMSLALFVTDADLFKFLNYVEKSKLLQNRSNIAYHAIFQDAYHHPINLCRNVALRNVVTPYVFLNDMDFVPMQGLYGSLKHYVSNIYGMERKALVVPAFDTNSKEKVKLPETRQELNVAINRHMVYQSNKRYFIRGHGITDYNRWKTAQNPYMVEWKFAYEPYIVVQSNVSGYDERFVGYGGDKSSFITKLKAQDYEFWVLPNSFIVQKRHEITPENRIYQKSPRYRKCLNNLLALVVQELAEEHHVKIFM